MMLLFNGQFLLFFICSQTEAFLFATRPHPTHVSHGCSTVRSICLICERAGFYPEMYCNSISMGDYCFTSTKHNSSGIFTMKGSATSSFCEANIYKSSLVNPACKTGNIPEGTECIDCCKQYNCKPDDLYCNKHIIQDIHMPFTVTVPRTTPTILTSTVPKTTDTTTQSTVITTKLPTTSTARSATPIVTTTHVLITCSGNRSVVCEDDPKAHCDSLSSFGLCTHLQFNPDTEDVKLCPRTCNLCDKYCDHVLRTTVQPATFSPPSIQCPSCDETLNCVGYQTCYPGEVCMIRSYPGTKFTTHCSRKEDCAFEKNYIGTGEIFCCSDRKCLSDKLGI